MEAEQQHKHQAYIPPIVVKFNSAKPPKFVEKQDKEYVFYGIKNDYPYYLLDIYKRSAKHCALINGKAKYVLGKGWQVNQVGMSAADLAMKRAALQTMNDEGESLDDISKKVFIDYLLFGGYAVEVIWQKAGKKIAEIRHVPFCDVRAGKDGETYYYTSKWYKKREGSGNEIMNTQPEEEEDYTEYTPFNPEETKGKQLFYFKRYTPHLEYYPIPEYMGIMTYIEIDIAISTFWNGLLKRGFSAGHIINFYTNTPPTQEQREALRDDIKAAYGGAFAEDTGGFVLNFASDRDHGSEILTLSPSDLDKQYQELNKTTQQEIFTGHGITNGMLFGIKTEGQLGGRTELIEANELFQNVYVSPLQKEFEQAFNYLLNFKGFGNSLQLGKLEPIGYMFKEETIEKYLPAEAMRDLVAEKMGVDLSKYKTPAPVAINSTQTVQNRFKKQIPSSIFTKYGQPASDFEVLHRRGVNCSKNLDENEVELRAEFQKFAKELSPLERSVLDLLSKDPLMDEFTMSEVIKNIEPETVAAAIKRLTENGYLKPGVKKTEGEKFPKYTLEPKAKSLLDKVSTPTDHIFVMYSYDWLPGFSDKDLPESRDFCRELIKLNRKYERKEIDAMDNEMGLPVWSSRGGWYTEPGTDIHISQCRHEWAVELVRKKTK